MRPSTVRRVVAGTVVVALVTLGAAALLATRGSGEPVWAGSDPLGVTLTPGAEIVVEPLALPDPARVAATALGSENPSFQTAKAETKTVYTDGDLSVRVREGTPVCLSGVRAPAEGDLPAPGQALQVATAMMRSFGLDAQQREAVQTDGAGFRAVTFGPKADLPVLSTGGQEAVVDVLVAKAVKAAKEHGAALLIGGGVAANSRLRAVAQERCERAGITLRVPRPGLCTDNGAMVAVLGSLLLAGGVTTPLDAAADPSLALA